MKRVASLYLPHWSIDRVLRVERRRASPPEFGALSLETASSSGGWRPGARWARGEDMRYDRTPTDDGGSALLPSRREALPAAAPVVTVHKVGARIEIASACADALRIGLTSGMALTQARAMVPGLEVREADHDGDRADLERLAILLARRWTPIVAISDEDGLFLDLTGVAHLYGGETRMARRLIWMLARFGYQARIAIAGTAGAAWALARFATDREQPVTDDSAATIDALPLAALRIGEKTVALLRRLGIETVGALTAMPRAPLARRFGAALTLRIDQAMGLAAEPLAPIVPPEQITIVHRFTEPISSAEAIAHWLDRLVPRLVDALSRARLGARVILLVAERVDRIAQPIRIGLACPNRDASHILRLLVRRVEEIEPGYGIDALRLVVHRADPLGPQQFDDDLVSGTPDLTPLVDTLVNRGARVWRAALVESDVPERSVRAIPPLAPPNRAPPALKPSNVRRLDLSHQDHPWHSRRPRPARLLRRPEPLDNVMAELPDCPPARFTWRGKTHRVARADGPERIAGEWWRRPSERDAMRDYFQVEDEAGARFWLFRRSDGERAATGDLTWFMHGAFG